VTITINTEPDSRRIYQRTAKTGGLNNLGEKGVTFNITLSGAVSDFEYRVLEFGTLTEIVTWASLGALGAGAQDVVCTVPADELWYVIEFREDGAGNITSTNQFGVGRLIAVSGQSLGSRLFLAANPVIDATYASQGFTVSDFVSAYATIDDVRSEPTAFWQKPGDLNSPTVIYDSLFLGYFGATQLVEYGVNIGIVGHCAGDQPIFQFNPGGSQNAALRAVLDAVDGFEVFLWLQGYADSQGGSFSDEYYGNLVTLITDVGSRNTLASFEKWLNAINNLETGFYGTLDAIRQIRYAQRVYARQNTDSKYLDCADIHLYTDGVHQNQIGSTDFARHIQRADTSDDDGPKPLFIDKTGAVITITYDALMTVVGTASDCYEVYQSNPFAQLTVNSVIVANDTVTITLSVDPGSVGIEIWSNPTDSTNTATSNIYDTRIADGYAVGRHIETSIDIIPGHNMNSDLVATSDTYSAAAVVAFGQEIDGGFSEAGDVYRPLPEGDSFTVEWRANIASAPAGLQVMVGQPNRFYVGVDPGTGNVRVNYLRWDATPFEEDTGFAVADGVDRHYSINFDHDGMTLYINGVLASTFTLPIFKDNDAAGANEFGVMRYNGVSDFDFAGAVDELAIFNGKKRTGAFTPPVMPFAETEENMWAIYHFDGNAEAGTIIIPSVGGGLVLTNLGIGIGI
jgi:hypothetical protein